MEIRIQRIFLKPLLALIGFGLCLQTPLQAAEPEDSTNPASQENRDAASKIFNPRVERREVEREAIDTEDWEFGLYYGIISIEDFGSNELVGAKIAYHVTEDFFIQGTYAESEAGLSSFERLTNIPLITDEDRVYTHFNISLGFNLLPGEGFIGEDLAFSSSFYLLTGLGGTDFAGEQHSTIMIGGGYRVLFTDWMAMHISLKDHLYDIELLTSTKTASDLEISTGFTIFF